MFCPQCGTNQSEELKFCKSCGANLFAVRQVVATRETGGKFDWSKSWLTEMFLSEGERERRKEELERQRGITPEVKRYKEIKAGVITASVGLSVAIFLAVFMEGIILGGNIPRVAVEIISRLWVVGVIPFSIGLGLIINGLFFGRAANAPPRPQALEKEPSQRSLRGGDAAEYIPSDASVTEGTTTHLRGPDEER